jgi:phosphoglycolate phosphatase
MQPYQVALFDFDGTLCDSCDAIIADIEATFAHFGKPCPQRAHLMTVMENGISMTESLKMLNPELMASGPALLKSWIDTYRQISRKNKRPMFEGVATVIKALKDADIKVLIVSNNTEANILRSLKRVKLEKHIDQIFAISEEYPLKPDPSVFHHFILPAYATFPSNSFMMIGDTATDLQFAQNVGIDSCWAQYGIGNTEDCDALNPTHRIHSLMEVVPLLLGTQSQTQK